MTALIEKNIPSKYFELVVKVFPKLSEVRQVLDDPEELHSSVEEVVLKLLEVLELDHGQGYGSKECKERAADIAKGKQSFPSRNNGDGEVDSGGSTDERVHELLLGREETSTGVDN